MGPTWEQLAAVAVPFFGFLGWIVRNHLAQDKADKKTIARAVEALAEVSAELRLTRESRAAADAVTAARLEKLERALGDRRQSEATAATRELATVVRTKLASLSSEEPSTDRGTPPPPPAEAPAAALPPARP
jgi:uncharacterized membrane protein YccC